MFALFTSFPRSLVLPGSSLNISCQLLIGRHYKLHLLVKGRELDELHEGFQYLFMEPVTQGNILSMH